MDNRLVPSENETELPSEGLPAGDRTEAMQQALRRAAELDSGSAVSRSHDEVMQSARRAIDCG